MTFYVKDQPNLGIDLAIKVFEVPVGHWYMSPNQPVTALVCEGYHSSFHLTDPNYVQIYSPSFVFSNSMDYPGTDRPCFPEAQSGWKNNKQGNISDAGIEVKSIKDNRLYRSIVWFQT